MLHARDVIADTPAVMFDFKSATLASSLAPPAQAGEVAERHPRPEAAAPDLPIAVGVLNAVAYVALLAAFLFVFLGSKDAVFNIGVCAVYLAVYLGVPTVMLRMEAKDRPQVRPDLADFLRGSLQTWTGRVAGRDAVLQMLLIPAAVTLCVLGIGLAIRLAQ